MASDRRKILSLSQPLSWAQQIQLSLRPKATSELSPSSEQATDKALRSTDQTITSSSDSLKPSSSDRDQRKTSSSSPKTIKEDKAASLEIEKQRRARVHQALVWLCQTFPRCFILDKPHPLKIGITEDIFQLMASHPDTDRPTRVSLRKALLSYTRTALYHQALLQATHRQDLEGQVAGEITPQEKAYAQAQLDVKQARQQTRSKKKMLRASPSSLLRPDASALIPENQASS